MTFYSPVLLIVTLDKATIKHSMYTWKVSFLYTERACVLFSGLKDERYFDAFSRSLYITAKSHECEQVLDPDYTPTNAEKDLFEAK